MSMPAAIETAAVGTSAAASDSSLWGLFAQAEITVQIIMLGLLFASFWSWTIIFSKFFQFRQLQSSANEFEDAFWSGKSLDALYDRLEHQRQNPFVSVFSAAMREWRRSRDKKGSRSESRAQLHDRIERIMQVTVNRELDRLERNLGFLASVGSSATFVGLFGTVWGVMHSFQGIAASKSTNLAVVAPGIAEALLATALGLVAAIPAMVAYNKFANQLNRYANRLETFSQEFGTIVSRQLDEAA